MSSAETEITTIYACYWIDDVIQNDRRDLAALNGPLARYVNLWVAHAPGMPGTFFLATIGKRSRHASRHVRDPRAVMHGGSLTRGFLWSQGRGNVPGIPGARAIHNFKYLVRDPCVNLCHALRGLHSCYRWAYTWRRYGMEICRRHCPSMRGIHRLTVVPPHKGFVMCMFDIILCQHEQNAKQTTELSVMWDAYVMSMYWSLQFFNRCGSRHSASGWASCLWG